MQEECFYNLNLQRYNEKKETINKTKIEALDSIEVEDVNLTGDFIINEFELTFLGNKIGVSTKKRCSWFAEKNKYGKY